MNKVKFAVAAAAIAVSGSAAVAGGLDAEIIEAPVMVVEPAPAARGSMRGALIPALVLLGLAAAASSSSSGS